MLFSLKRGYGEMSESSHQADISKLRDKVAILPRHGVRHPHEEVSGVQEGEAVRLPPMSHLRSRRRNSRRDGYVACPSRV